MARTLIDVKNDAADCTKCNLCFGREHPVFSRGPMASPMMIIGMCPGPDENRAGAPFVGRSGRLLDKTIRELNITPPYITNLVKCYVKPGRKMEQQWIDACFPYLMEQIKTMKPEIIITLGADASFALVKPQARKYMKDIRGKFWRTAGNLRILPTYHPSWVLRRGGYQSTAYKIFRNDMEKAWMSIK